MPAFMIALSRVDDPEAIKAYAEAGRPSVNDFKGKFIMAGGIVERLEGNIDKNRIAVFEFEDRATIRAWFESPSYQEARQIRLGKGEFDFFIVDG